MDKTIENRFFEAYRAGGVVSDCLEWMGWRYNLPAVKGGGVKWDDENAARRYYGEMAARIVTATEKFETGGVEGCAGCPLMDEIRANVDEVKADADGLKEYLYSLLLPFGGYPGGGLATAIYQITDYLDRAIVEQKEALTRWKTGGTDERGTGRQVAAIGRMIARYEDEKQYLQERATRLGELLGRVEDGAEWMKPDTVENCLSSFVGLMHKYAYHLDAVLLRRGIDLMRLQEESGVCLVEYTSAERVKLIGPYMGGERLTRRYLDEVAGPQRAEGGASEPQRHKTNKEKKEERDRATIAGAAEMWNKAVSLGLVEVEAGGGYLWKESKALYGYFVDKATEKIRNGGRIPWRLFDGIITNHSLLVDEARSARSKINNESQSTPINCKKVDTVFE